MTFSRLLSHSCVQYHQLIRGVTMAVRPPQVFHPQIDLKPSITDTVPQVESSQNFIQTTTSGSSSRFEASGANPAREMLKHLKNLDGGPIEDFELHLDTSSDANVDFIADLIYSTSFLEKVSDTFDAFLKVSPDFKPSRFLGDQKISLYQFHCHHAHWFTGAHLLAMDCSWIFLHRCTFKNQDINSFLLSWNSGNYKVFMGFYMEMLEGCDLDFEQVLQGVVDPDRIQVNNRGSQCVSFNRKRDGRYMELKMDSSNRKLTCSLICTAA